VQTGQSKAVRNILSFTHAGDSAPHRAPRVTKNRASRYSAQTHSLEGLILQHFLMMGRLPTSDPPYQGCHAADLGDRSSAQTLSAQGSARRRLTFLTHKLTLSRLQLVTSKNRYHPRSSFGESRIGAGRSGSFIIHCWSLICHRQSRLYSSCAAIS